MAAHFDEAVFELIIGHALKHVGERFLHIEDLANIRLDLVLDGLRFATRSSRQVGLRSGSFRFVLLRLSIIVRLSTLSRLSIWLIFVNRRFL